MVSNSNWTVYKLKYSVEGIEGTGDHLKERKIIAE